MICRIQDNQLTWVGVLNVDPVRVDVRDGALHLMDAVGKLRADGSIRWSDGDVWQPCASSAQAAPLQRPPDLPAAVNATARLLAQSSAAEEASSAAAAAAAAAAACAGAAAATGAAASLTGSTATPSGSVAASAAAAFPAAARAAPVAGVAAAATGVAAAVCASSAASCGVSSGGEHKLDGGEVSSGGDSPVWCEMRARKSWDNADYDDGYLGFIKGELLLVRPGLEDGWAYARSIQREKEGWIPPDYLATEQEARSL